MAVLGHLLRKWQIPILWQGHGVNVFPEHLAIVLGDKVGAEYILTSMERQLEGTIYGRYRMHVGSLCHSNLSRSLGRYMPLPHILSRRAACDNFRILIITNGVSYGNIPLVDAGKYWELVREALSVPNAIADKVEIIIKPKANWDATSLFEHARRYAPRPERVHILENVSIGAAIELSDVCLGIGPETSAYIDAIIFGKPLFRLRDKDRKYFDRGDNCQLPQHVYVDITDGREFWTKVEALLNFSRQYSEIVTMQQSVVSESGLLQDVTEKFEEAAELACKVQLQKMVKSSRNAAVLNTYSHGILEGVNGHVDKADIRGSFVAFSGWAGDLVSGAAPLAVLLLADGKLIKCAPLTQVRVEVSPQQSKGELFGFTFLAAADEVLRAKSLTAVALFENGQTFALRPTKNLRQESCVRTSYRGELPPEGVVSGVPLPQLSEALDGSVDGVAVAKQLLILSGRVGTGEQLFGSGSRGQRSHSGSGEPPTNRSYH